MTRRDLSELASHQCVQSSTNIPSGGTRTIIYRAQDGQEIGSCIRLAQQMQFARSQHDGTSNVNEFDS